MGKVAFAEPAEQMTDEVFPDWHRAFYQQRRGAIPRRTSSVSLWLTASPKGKPFGWRFAYHPPHACGTNPMCRGTEAPRLQMEAGRGRDAYFVFFFIAVDQEE